MAASKNRPRWHELPARARGQIERLAGDRVVAAENCDGGFSPGFASRLTLAGGRRVFAKAVDASAWPSQAPTYRDEARIAVALPATAPATRLVGWDDDGRFVVLLFECADGAEPRRPWQPVELARVARTLSSMAAMLTPSPVRVPAGHPRLGGWAELAEDSVLAASLRGRSPWAAGHLELLTATESRGLEAANGTTLVHFDPLPHNILLSADRVLLADWPHARLGAPFIDTLMLLASAAADGVDPEPLLRVTPVIAHADPGDVTAVLAALAGFWLAGALAPATPGLEPIAVAKLDLGLGALGWLRRRLPG